MFAWAHALISIGQGTQHRIIIQMVKAVDANEGVQVSAVASVFRKRVVP